MLVDQEKRTIAAINLNFCNGSEKTTLRKKTRQIYMQELNQINGIILITK